MQKFFHSEPFVLWIGPVATSFLFLVIGLTAICSQGETWATSDLDGHYSTIELYRRALEHGHLWPHDIASGFGTDATPHYGWWCELILGSLALLLGWIGVPTPSLMVVFGVVLLGTSLLPLLTAWCVDQMGGPGRTYDARLRGLLVGTAAGVAYACFKNGNDGYGILSITGVGLINQALGWIGFLLVVGRAGRLLHEPERRDIDLWLAAAIAYVLTAHALSALASAVVLAWCLLFGPWRTIIWSGMLGVGLAAGSLVTLVMLSGQQYDYPFILAMPDDPILAALEPYFLHQSDAGLSLVTSALQIALVVGSVRAFWSPSPARVLSWAGWTLVALAILPLGRTLLVSAQPTAHVGRFASFGALLLCVAGSDMLVDFTVWIQSRARAWILTAAALPVVLVFLLITIVQCWPSPPSERTLTIPQTEAKLRSALPPGARVLFGNGMASVWHRTAIDRWARDMDLLAVNSFFNLNFPPPIVMPIAHAARSLGIAPWLIADVEPWPKDVGIRGLQDAGITHLIQYMPDMDRGSVEPKEVPPANWEVNQVDDFRIWKVPTPAPSIEEITGEVIGVLNRPSGNLRPLIAEWWGRIRARHQLSSRLVFTSAANPSFTKVIELPGPEHGAPGLATMETAAAKWPRWHAPQAIGTGASSERHRYVESVYEALRPIEMLLSVKSSKGTSSGSPSAIAALPRIREAWSIDRQEAQFSGLRPGAKYLWRCSWSSGFTSADAQVLEEASGFTVIIPQRSEVTVHYTMLNDRRLWIATAISFVAMTIFTVLLWRRFHAARRDKPKASPLHR